ncbi:MAG: polysaccharide deacetylase family protein [Thermoguttaceae bacterium]
MMNPGRTLLLNAYYHVSQPLRWWNGRCAAARRRVPIAVLAYHRIADDRANGWTVSQRTFARHIAWLDKHFDFISLEEAQRRIAGGGNCRPAVSITFDDGYAENCVGAIPLLVKERIPCTYFVTVRNVLSGEPFAHDLVGGNSLPPNSLDQLQAMAAAGIEIAAHGYTHADLGPMADPQALRREVVTAGEELHSALGRPVRYFAFPFGLHANLSAAAFALARGAGYEAVCSCYGGFNFPGDDAFHLQRIAPGDDMIHLKNWMTVDPRKLKIPRFAYDRLSPHHEDTPVRL